MCTCIFTHEISRLPGICQSATQFSCLVVSDSLRPRESQHARPPCPSPTPRVYPNSCIESVMPSNHLILCHPLLLLPSPFPSIGVFSNESALHIRWPKYWSFSFNIRNMSEFFKVPMVILLLNLRSQLIPLAIVLKHLEMYCTLPLHLQKFLSLGQITTDLIGVFRELQKIK